MFSAKDMREERCSDCVVCEHVMYLRLVLTVVIDLVWVWYQTAIVRSRRQSVRDPIVVVVIVALITQPVFVCVQLRAIDHEWAVILCILVTVAITTLEMTQSHDINQSCSSNRRRSCLDICKNTTQRLWRYSHLSWFVSQESPTRSLSTSD